jgi:hypothetical protein
VPYIDPDRRRALDAALTNGNISRIDQLGAKSQSAGELNYLISKLFVGYVKRHGLSYAIINDILGAGVGAVLEFYRRVALPFD